VVRHLYRRSVAHWRTLGWKFVDYGSRLARSRDHVAVLDCVLASVTGRVAAVSGVHHRILKLAAGHAVLTTAQDL